MFYLSRKFENCGNEKNNPKIRVCPKIESSVNGQFQKIPIHNDGWLQYFNPLPLKIPCLSKMCYLPMPSEFHNGYSYLPLGISLFLQTLQSNQMCSQLCGTWVILHQLVSHHPTFVTEGVILIDSRYSGKNWKNKQFLFTLVQ